MQANAEPASAALRIAAITSAHVSVTARTLAGAFEVDAAYRYLMPDDSTRAAGLEAFFAGNLGVHLPHACTRVALDDARRVLGTVTLRPPGGIAITPWTMLRHGLLPFARAHGLGAVRRLLWLKKVYDGLEAELAPGPHWYVHMMAVAPEHQGRGVGSELLDTVLRQAARTAPVPPTVLTTHLERNLVFYARAGFREAWARRIEPPSAAPYTVWGMVRDGTA